jgi:hypothetical protein
MSRDAITIWAKIIGAEAVLFCISPVLGYCGLALGAAVVVAGISYASSTVPSAKEQRKIGGME